MGGSTVHMMEKLVETPREADGTGGAGAKPLDVRGR